MTFSPNQTVTLTATGGASGNSVTFTIDPSSTGAGHINNGNVLTITGAGNIVVDANQSGNTTYNTAGTVQQTLVVNKANQTINFTAPSPVTYAPNLTVNLSATGGATNNPVVFTIDSTSTGAGTINGNMLTVTLAGNIVIDANQAGNSNYNAAPQAQKTLVVSKAGQTINFTAPAPVTFAPNLTVTLNATATSGKLPWSSRSTPRAPGAGTISGNILTVDRRRHHRPGRQSSLGTTEAIITPRPRSQENA